MQAEEFDAKFRKILAANKSHPYLLWAVSVDEVVEAFDACMARKDGANTGAEPPALLAMLEPAAAARGATEHKARRVLRSDPELEAMQIV